jgi:hypothetical protein
VAPAPQTISGVGKKITQDFPIVGGLTSFTLTNDGSSNFIVWLMDSKTGARKALLVNEIGPFSGSSQLGLTGGPYALDITGGNWKIVIEQPLYGSGARVPTSFSGRGMTASAPFQVTQQSLVRFQMHHDGSSNFIIWLLDSSGNRKDLLVNEIGPVDSSKGVSPAPGVYVMQIEADGNWTVGVS